jgi:folate-binding protein YgfZ
MSVAEEARRLIETAGVRALDERILVRVGGEEARTWLNGQVSNDVRATSPGDAVYALVLQVKGRIIADLHVLDRGDAGLAIVVPRANLEALLAHFDKYIIMEDVVLERDEGTAILTVQGPRAAEVVRDLELPVFPCDRLGRGGRDVLVPVAERERVLAFLADRALRVGGGPVSLEGWELARIRLGRPALFADFGEFTVPQEAGLRDLAVSFSKGCYLGQEVVCMLENRGQLTRRLVRLESTQPLARGDAILHADEGRVGEITSAVGDPESGGSLALGFVKRRLIEAGAELRTEHAELRIVGIAGDPPGV